MDSKELSEPLDHTSLYYNSDQNEERWSLSSKNKQNKIKSLNENDSYIYQEDLDNSFSFQDNIPNIKTTSSYSPTVNQIKNSHIIDSSERMQFLREMEQTRDQLEEFRKSIDGLVNQMNGISIDLDKSTDRVCEIEQDLTATEEVNVNLQVLLERAVKSQKETDTFATQAIRHLYSDLTSIVYENSQLQGRINVIENHQREQNTNVHDMIQKIYEYTEMLEQAQGTIHMLQEPRPIKSLSMPPSTSSFSESRRTSLLSLYDDDNSSIGSSLTTKESHMNTDLNYHNTNHPNINNLNISSPPSTSFIQNTSNLNYLASKRKSIISYIPSPALGPESTTIKPQQGLRMLFDSSSGTQIGLSSLAQRRI